jgi:hypothetical protein
VRTLAVNGHFFEHEPIGVRNLDGHLLRPADPAVHFVRRTACTPDLFVRTISL